MESLESGIEIISWLFNVDSRNPVELECLWTVLSSVTYFQGYLLASLHRVTIIGLPRATGPTQVSPAAMAGSCQGNDSGHIASGSYSKVLPLLVPTWGNLCVISHSQE